MWILKNSTRHELLSPVVEIAAERKLKFSINSGKSVHENDVELRVCVCGQNRDYSVTRQ